MFLLLWLLFHAVRLCVCGCVQGGRETPSARAAQLGPQTLVNLFNSPLYSDVIFMVQGGSPSRRLSPQREETPLHRPLPNYYRSGRAPRLHSISVVPYLPQSVSAALSQI